MERRLAAILAADVVGFTRLMGQDEAGTFHRLNELRENVLKPLITGHRGRIVKLLGDGLLVEFPSVVESIACALAWQENVGENQVSAHTDMALSFRIGVNLGDVIVEEDDIYGDGVNIAARLEALADPGGIAVSAKVYEEVRQKLEIAFEDQGSISLHNVADPVQVYKVVGRSYSPSSSTPPVSKPSLIVLPFDNLSGDPEQEFFADGLTEDVIASLSAWRYFPVVPRGTSLQFKGNPSDPRKIADELGVRYVLEGSVRRSGKRIRITVQLNDAVEGQQVWSERYDRDLEDIFSVQDEIAHRVAAVVAPELEKAEGRRLHSASPANLGAWELVQRGVRLLQDFTSGSNANARSMFNKAIKLDPQYTKAHTGLAYSYHRDIFWDYAGDRNDWIDQIHKAATNAVRLDDTDSSAQLVLGYAQIWARNFDLAEPVLRRAMHLHPGNAFAHVALGEAIDLSGRPSDAIQHMRVGIDLNQRDPRVHTFIGALARVHLNARDYDEAVAVARRALELRPDYPHANAFLISALGHFGQLDEARAAWLRFQGILPGFAVAYQNSSDTDHYVAGVQKSGVLGSIF